MSALWIAGAAGILLAALLAAAVYILTGRVARPRVRSFDEAFDAFGERGKALRRLYDSLPHEAFTVCAGDGTALSCELIRAETETSPPRIVIMAHGFGFNRAGEVKYIPFFRKRGFHVVLFDQRHAGASGGRYTTMGAKERYDLLRVTDAVFARFGEDAVVGTHGESMGGATVLLNAALDGRLAFVVADCAYASCREQLAYTLSKRARPLAWLLIPLCSRMAKLRAGFSFDDACPEKALAQIERPLPILFAHGTADSVVPCGAAARLLQAYRGPKDVLYGRGSGHTHTALDYPAEYDQAVGALLKRCGL